MPWSPVSPAWTQGRSRATGPAAELPRVAGPSASTQMLTGLLGPRSARARPRKTRPRCIFLFFSSRRKSNSCKRKAVSSPFGAGKKIALCSPFPACLPKFAFSLFLPRVQAGQSQQGWPWCPCSSLGEGGRGAAAASPAPPPRPAQGALGGQLPTRPLLSLAKLCPFLKFKALVTSSEKPPLTQRARWRPTSKREEIPTPLAPQWYVSRSRLFSAENHLL